MALLDLACTPFDGAVMREMRGSARLTGKWNSSGGIEEEQYKKYREDRH